MTTVFSYDPRVNVAPSRNVARQGALPWLTGTGLAGLGGFSPWGNGGVPPVMQDSYMLAHSLGLVSPWATGGMMGNSSTGLTDLTGLTGTGLSPNLTFSPPPVSRLTAPSMGNVSTDIEIQQLGQYLAQLYPNKQITIMRGEPTATANPAEVATPTTTETATTTTPTVAGQPATNSLGLPEGENLIDIFRNSIADKPAPVTTGVTVNEETGEATTGIASIDNATFNNGILEVNAFDYMKTVNTLTGGRAFNDKTLAMVNKLRKDHGIEGTVQEEIGNRKLGFDGRPKEQKNEENDEADD